MIGIVAAALMAAAIPPPDKALSLDELHDLYQQSCQVRAYGSYDDLCSALRKEMNAAEKAARKATVKTKTAAAAPPAPTPTATPLPPASTPAP